MTSIKTLNRLDSELSIESSSADFTYHGSQLINREEDVFHNVDALVEITIDGVCFTALYQCGMTFANNDYNRSSTNLALSDNSTDDFIFRLNQLTEDEIENFNASEVAEFTETLGSIKTIDDLLVVHHGMNDALIEVNLQFDDFKVDNALSDDPDMWVNEEVEPYLRLRKSDNAAN